MFHRPLISALLVALTAPVMADSVTYRGQLLEDGAAADGRYDLQFSLYADRDGRRPLMRPIEVADVVVSEGQFAVALDLPDIAAESAWLAVAVRASGEDTY